jgi:hypothetical protein
VRNATFYATDVSYNSKLFKTLSEVLTWNPYGRGKPNTVDLLVKITSFDKKKKICIKSNLSKLISVRRSIVLIPSVRIPWYLL